MIYFVLPYFVFSFAFAANPVFSNVFSKKDYSYGLYFYGFLVQQMLIAKFSYLNLSLNYYIIVSIAATFVFANQIMARY